MWDFSTIIFLTFFSFLSNVGLTLQSTPTVWKDYVKSHPNAKDFRYAPIPLFDKLAHAFGKDRATGK
ncbi:hypothetical protein QL285_074302 [Trifolium repens]|nr:hypothetical protein QL285_074302 [Trifolium repens]